MVWMERSRLNAARWIPAHSANPEMRATIHRLVTNVGPATAGLDNLTDVQWGRSCWRDGWGRVHCRGGGWGRHCWRDRWGHRRCRW